MSLANVVRSGVRVANKLTASLQVPIQHSAWIGQDDYSKALYSPVASIRQAIVEMGPVAVRTTRGEIVFAKAKVTIIGPIPDNGASGRSEPIDPRDKIILPDGSVGDILEMSAPIDPATMRPYYYEVTLR